MSEPISCAGATSEIIVGIISDSGIINIEVNHQSLGFSHPYRDGVVNTLSDLGIEMIPMDENNNVLTFEGLLINDQASRAHFINHTNEYKRIRIELGDASKVRTNYTPENDSFDFNTETNITTFCLAPAK